MLSDHRDGVRRERAKRAADRDLQTDENLCRLRTLDGQQRDRLTCRLDHGRQRRPGRLIYFE
jgi:hypothetical protein